MQAGIHINLPAGGSVFGKAHHFVKNDAGANFGGGCIGGIIQAVGIDVLVGRVAFMLINRCSRVGDEDHGG